MSTAPDPRAVEARARLRADVAWAARIIAPAWPLHEFVAVNPLADLVDRPFEAAIAEAAGVRRARVLPPLAALREAVAAGRVSPDDVRAALAERIDGLEDLDDVPIGGTAVPPADLLLADLLHGPEDPAPNAQPRTLGEWADALLGTAIAPAIDEEAGRWCAAATDEHAPWPMPGREHGLWPAWRALAAAGAASHLGLSASAAARLPERADDAVLAALEALGTPGPRRRAELRGHFAQLPGWSALARYAAEHPEEAVPIDLMQVLALRCTLEAALVAAAAREAIGGRTPIADLRRRADEEAAADAGSADAAHEHLEARAHALAQALGADAVGPEARAVLSLLPAGERGAVGLAAAERAYRRDLLDCLDHAPGVRPERPAAQVVCCIDVRSEGLRRHLEAAGSVETLGFAGFFAVAVRYRPLGSATDGAACPVLLEPRNAIAERPSAGAEAQAQRRLEGLQAAGAAESGLHAAREALASPFAVAEVGGWLAGPAAAVKTAGARSAARLRGRARDAIAPPAPTSLTIDAEHGLGLAPEEQALVGEAALRMMGLTSGFARLVVLCGHGSTTDNNPYAAALDCGACGGRQGGPNARAAAAILNAPAVRATLADHGIAIPADTVFAAAQHDTTTDTVAILDRHLIPASHADDVAALEQALAAAGDTLAAERCAALPLAPRAGSRRHAERRAGDWAQVRPEWGLARNAAFIVGPREMTAGLHLGCRTFLHSYRPESDPDASGLETILTAPLVVAQWINSQYYFSTVDPEAFGAGDKTLHNVVGDVGVVLGPGGDLQIGLPWQSVMLDGARPYHEPLRLLAVVQAPLDRTTAIIERNEILRRLIDGGWVSMVAREDGGAPWLRRRDRAWIPAGGVAEAVMA